MIFVTGTDTGCGKTTVGRAIAAALRRRGVTVGVFKPFETGCLPQGDGLVAADATALARAAGCALSPDIVCPYRLKLPASPERAAKAEGLTPRVSRLKDSWNKVKHSSEFVLAEGAGGLLVPIMPKVMMIDIPALLQLPVVLVARDALGTVNHTLLAIEALRRRKLELLGVVFSATEADSATGNLENAAAVAAYGQVEILGTFPHLPAADDATLAEAAETHIELDVLLRHG